MAALPTNFLLSLCVVHFSCYYGLRCKTTTFWTELELKTNSYFVRQPDYMGILKFYLQTVFKLLKFLFLSCIPLNSFPSTGQQCFSQTNIVSSVFARFSLLLLHSSCSHLTYSAGFSSNHNRYFSAPVYVLLYNVNLKK